MGMCLICGRTSSEKFCSACKNLATRIAETILVSSLGKATAFPGISTCVGCGMKISRISPFLLLKGDVMRKFPLLENSFFGINLLQRGNIFGVRGLEIVNNAPKIEELEKIFGRESISHTKGKIYVSSERNELSRVRVFFPFEVEDLFVVELDERRFFFCSRECSLELLENVMSG